MSGRGAPAPRRRELLSVREAAAILGISERSAYEAIQGTGMLAGVAAVRMGLTGRGIRIPRAQLLRALGRTDETSR